MSPRQLTEQKPGSTKTLIPGLDGAVVRRTVLPGGLRVITEAMPTVRSVSFGVWVGVGSRDETPALAGSSHYLEHVLFKGTKRRDALEISAALDAVGGEMNAFTSKEYTCFYARVLDNDLPLAVDVISDMMTSSVVRSADVDSERGVILEEIAMHEDDPGDVVHDAFAEALFGDTPLGRPILGTVESINALQRTAINGYYRRRYRPENMVIAAAGNLDHAKVVRLVAKAFGEMLNDDAQIDRRPSPPRVGGRPPVSRSGVSVVQRPTEQAHLVLGVPCLVAGRRTTLRPRGAERRARWRHEFAVVPRGPREARARLLRVQLRGSSRRDRHVRCVRRLPAGEGSGGARHLPRPARSRRPCGHHPEELSRGKGQLAGALVLGLEDTGSRMSRLGKAELVYGELLTVDELLARIDAVTLEQVRDVAATVLSAKQTLAVIGPFDENAFADAVA